MNENIIIKKLIEHDDRFDNVNENLGNFREAILQGQDKIIGMLRRQDADFKSLKSQLKIT